ncbi:MAG: TIGR04086 family membrane protein [Clostridiales bacterium]|jgi:putative membrane protein (TIGR04086 family)|nr:TIGR04086 family membrane protein [Clostridiales bacterium]
MRKSDPTNKKKSSYMLEMLKALVLSLIMTLVLILLAALLIMLCNLPDRAIPIINQAIKGISILVAALICFRLPSNGWIRGLVFGILYIALSEIVFALLNGGFTFGLHTLNDLAVGCITGLISGIVAVNVIRSHRITV